MDSNTSNLSSAVNSKNESDATLKGHLLKLSDDNSHDNYYEAVINAQDRRLSYKQQNRSQKSKKPSLSVVCKEE